MKESFTSQNFLPIFEGTTSYHSKANIRALITVFSSPAPLSKVIWWCFPPPSAPSRMLGSEILTATFISTLDLWDWPHGSPKPQTSIVFTSSHWRPGSSPLPDPGIHPPTEGGPQISAVSGISEDQLHSVPFFFFFFPLNIAAV